MNNVHEVSKIITDHTNHRFSFAATEEVTNKFNRDVDMVLRAMQEPEDSDEAEVVLGSITVNAATLSGKQAIARYLEMAQIQLELTTDALEKANKLLDKLMSLVIGSQ